MKTTSMLKYAKKILQKVSFDRELFKKEYQKSLRWLNKKEAEELRIWIRSNRVLMLLRERSSQ